MTRPRYKLLPGTLRVNLNHEKFPDFYVLIVPNRKCGLKHRDFYLASDCTAFITYMLGTAIESYEEAADIALANAEDYLPYYDYEGE